MGTAFFSVNVVYIGKDIFTVGIAVLHCNFYDDTVLFAFQVNRFSVDFIFVVINIIYKFNDTATKVEGFSFTTFAFITQGNGDAFIQERKLTNTHTQSFVAINQFGENGSVRFEVNGSTGFSSVTFYIKLGSSFALFKSNAIAFTATTNFYIHAFRKCVNASYTYAVQTAGNFITAIAKFTTGVENGHNNFNCRFAFFFHHINRNTTTIIAYGNTVIFVDDYTNVVTIACQSFVDTVIDNFINQMMQTTSRGTTNIHCRSFTYCFQTF